MEKISIVIAQILLFSARISNDSQTFPAECRIGLEKKTNNQDAFDRALC